MAIDSDKVAALGPGRHVTWAPFAGWSVLFDPPANGLRRVGTERLRRLARTHASLRADPLLCHLDRIVRSVARWPETAGALALVPPPTYHVTVCDGLSVRDARPRTPAGRRVGALLARLPAAVDDPDAITMSGAVALDRLLVAASQGLRLAAETLEVRGHALVLALRPGADETAAWEAIDTARRALLVHLSEHAAEVDVETPWRPHITLAYAADADHAERLAARVRTAADLLAGVGTARLRCDRASVYAFDDMVTFRTSTRPADRR